LKQEVNFREANQNEKEHWDDLVKLFPNYQVFHLSGWVKSIEAISGEKALYLIGEKDGQIVACCSGFIKRIFGICLFTSPREGWQTEFMGPVFNPEAINTNDLISSLESFLRKKFRVIYFEISSRVLDQFQMQKLGFVEDPISTLRTPLPPGEPEQMFLELEGKTRNHLRKALKIGLIAEIGFHDAFVDTFYSQIKEVFNRNKAALPFSRRRIASVFKYLNSSDNLLAISIFLPEGEKCIATGIYLIANHEMYLWGWAHLKEYGSFYPIELLTWTAMEIAIQRGCAVLDFGGLGKAKKKYNALLDDRNRRWMKSTLPGMIEIRFLARRVYRWQQKLRGNITSFIKRT
jgi:Acetyltransferase (GNAT) domain